MLEAETLTLKALEWDKIKERLKAFCNTPMGRARVDTLRPSTELEWVKSRLQETQEALELLRHSPPLREMEDIDPYIQLLEKEGVLREEEILKIRDFLSLGERLREFLSGFADSAPKLARIGRSIPDLTLLIENINYAISEDGRLKDSASIELRVIRESLRNLIHQIQEKLNEMINSPSLQRYLQEPIITQREGRYCLAVKREFKDKVEGIVHSTSSSGATLFIEPLAIIKYGNKLRELERKEEMERVRILRKLSKMLKGKASALRRTREAIGLLDFILAKGRLALSLNAFRPSLNQEGLLFLKNARHPLLPLDRAVPVSLELSPQKRVLIITGPNTGGKTTTLKMVGLLCFMVQCGLFIPASEESTLPLFQTILADIGEEQSIEQSLSTFSSHITQIKRIFENLKGLSLVLLDELGAGTDPAEGSAIARAIVEHLADKEDVRLLVATHLSELKLLPFTNPFVRGASFEFDPVSLQPTFKLVMDAIGKSHAIEVAERLGLSEELLIKARELMNYVQPHSQLIARIEEERKFLREEKERVSSLREEYERKLRELEEEREKILSSAREEAMSFLMGIQEKVEEILSAKGTKKEKRAEWRKLWEEIRGEQGVVFQIGDRVRLKTLSREGIVVDIKGERIVIEVEGKKMQVPFGELELSPKKKSEEVEAQPYVPQSIIMKDVNLRGMTVEEALYEIDRELDRASLEGIGKLRLIHGKGKGILRKAIWEFLRGHPLVKDFRLGEVWEGSYGTTIVTLK